MVPPESICSGRMVSIITAQLPACRRARVARKMPIDAVANRLSAAPAKNSAMATDRNAQDAAHHEIGGQEAGDQHDQGRSTRDLQSMICAGVTGIHQQVLDGAGARAPGSALRRSG